MKITYDSLSERNSIIVAQTELGFILVEEGNIENSNYLVFTSPEELNKLSDIEKLQQENILLKAQNKVLTDRTDFHEELIAELAMLVYP
ncbi:hypothetical protein [Cytobacillus praedii]|uniref:hypothetical protein n=1 Tax=Cytobacillus praedii TaxID=1742358 RepID=UPI002E1B9F19|nr:hypothetical protein [Cytobacillus praedii]